MTIFLILALYLLAVWVIYGGRAPKKEAILCAVGFILVLALRSPYNGCDLVGGDYTLSNSYYGAFSRMPQYGFSELIRGEFYSHFEMGFLLYTKLISLLTNDFQWFIAITSVVQILPLAFFFYKFSPNITLSFFVFGCLDFFSFYFSGLRQSLAISIGTIGIYFLINNKVRYYLISIMAASFFHLSAIFMLLLLPIYRLKLSFAKAISFCLIILFLIPILRPLLLWISETFLGGSYESYLQSGSSALTMFLIYMFFLLFSYFNKTKDHVLNVLRWIVLIGVFFQSFGAVNNGALTRGGYYFLICLALLLPFILNALGEKAERQFAFLMSVFLLCIFFILTVEGPRNVVPYYFFWEMPL